jgi:hypothetical protein
VTFAALRSKLLSLNQRGLQVDSWPSEDFADRFGLYFPLVWQVFATAILIRTGHFTYDQAYFYEVSIRTARTLELPGYGPFVSGFYAGPMTPGGMLFVAYALPFVFFDDPRAGHVWICILALIGAVLFDRSQKILRVPPAIRIATLVLYLSAASHSRAQETFWNGDFFLFVTPMLLWLALRIAGDKRDDWRFYLAFGALAGTSPQTHISGALGVVLCVVIAAAVAEKLPPWKWVGLAIGAALAMYAPYLWREYNAGFPNTELLKIATPQGGPFWPQVWKALGTPFVFMSHAAEPSVAFTWPQGDWTRWACFVTGALTAALALLGLLVRHPLKLFGVLAVLAMQAFFVATRRPFFDHYVMTLVPFVCVFAGGGLGWLFSKKGAPRVAASLYAAYAVATGAAMLVAQLERPVLTPGHPYFGMNVAMQLERTQRALAYGAPVPSAPGDEHALALWILARRVYGKDLTFNVMGHHCRIKVRLSGFSDTARWAEVKDLPRVGENTGWQCPP